MEYNNSTINRCINDSKEFHKLNKEKNIEFLEQNNYNSIKDTFSRIVKLNNVSELVLIQFSSEMVFYLLPI